MTDQDELRDRISAVIDKGLASWDVDPFDTRTDTEAAAQAIIDEFGLTVETGMDEQYGSHTRIVGKWEPK